ncbi:MAG: hypothetical protein HOI53_09190 [Francisellaceae bacterium]|jgi:hypothetical protein|nr:hypothetical protein [Francisellaceae bacterium]MBT6208187.1 hypothetical protein [Francisellaceae bacterium]MBT6538891.1 hypothetical protein [Francisellaceae bacterium]
MFLNIRKLGGSFLASILAADDLKSLLIDTFPDRQAKPFQQTEMDNRNLIKIELNSVNDIRLALSAINNIKTLPSDLLEDLRDLSVNSGLEDMTNSNSRPNITTQHKNKL